MRVIYKDNTIQREQEYPNKRIEYPVIGLNKKKVNGELVDDDSNFIQFYFIQETKEENHDINRYDLIQQPDLLSEDIHKEYSHLKICYRKWILVEKSQEEIINNVNNDYGQYVDSEYPQVVRMNHIIEQIEGTSDERSNYIKSLQNWLLQCKQEKRKQD